MFTWLRHWCLGYTPGWWNHVDVLVKERRNSVADALELRLSCTDPSVNVLVKERLTPLLMHWSYVFLALTHRCERSSCITSSLLSDAISVPSDTIWWQRSWSTLVQVMAFWLMARNHYLAQCWLTISNVRCHIFEGNFTKDTSAIYQ